MKKFLLAIPFLLLAAASLGAQASSSNKLVIDEPAPTLAAAQGYQYKYYESTNPGVVLAGTTCTGTASPYTCKFTFPAFTPGTHTITVTASDTSVTPPLESAKSAPLTFTFVIAPAVPQNPRTE